MTKKISKLQVLQKAAREDLLSFAVYCDKFFDIVRIHEQMARALKKVEEGKTKKLILMLPPRSGKSRIVREFIAKFFGKYPHLDILLTGHSSSLLEGFSREIQNRINSREYQSLYKTKIKEGNSGVKSWKTNEGGEFAIYGVGGGITGRGGNLLIIDDPYATREEAESDTIRKKVSNWYWSTFLSRRHNDKAAQIIIMQRWREDDLVGEILEKEGDEWEVVKVPAIDEKGQSFWQERFSIKYLLDMKDKIGPVFFASQYQQDPVNEGSGEFVKEYFHYYDFEHLIKIRSRLDIVSFLDPAFSEKQEADFNGLVTIGLDRTSNIIYLLEVKQLKGTTDFIIDEVFKTARLFKNVGNSYKFGYEVIAGQKTLGDNIKKEMRLRDFFFKFVVVGSQGNKVARIKVSLVPRYSVGTIIHPNFGKSVGELESELLKFPNGKHDDLIDSLSSAVLLTKNQDLDSKPQQVAGMDDENFLN